MSKKIKMSLVFLQLRWSGTYQKSSEWSVMIKRLGNTELDTIVCLRSKRFKFDEIMNRKRTKMIIIFFFSYIVFIYKFLTIKKLILLTQY